MCGSLVAAFLSPERRIVGADFAYQVVGRCAPVDLVGIRQKLRFELTVGKTVGRFEASRGLYEFGCGEIHLRCECFGELAEGAQVVECQFYGCLVPLTDSAGHPPRAFARFHAVGAVGFADVLAPQHGYGRPEAVAECGAERILGLPDGSVAGNMNPCGGLAVVAGGESGEIPCSGNHHGECHEENYSALACLGFLICHNVLNFTIESWRRFGASATP